MASSYSTSLTINDKSLDGVLGIRTWGGRIVGSDESIELWRHPYLLNIFLFEPSQTNFDLKIITISEIYSRYVVGRGGGHRARVIFRQSEFESR